MNVALCVLLWPQPDAADALAAYEDKVLALVPEHGGSVLQRARSDGADGQPLEVQVLEFPSAAALSDYMSDDRRLSLTDEREHAISRTEVIYVDLIQPGPPGQFGQSGEADEPA